jgi:type II secretory pathway pseudopilin PulG
MKSEKGITLIELLAALSILMIISSVIYSVFFGINKNYKQISEKTNLQQDANIIISSIKNYHLRNESYKLLYNSTTQKAFIGKDTANIQLEREDLIVTRFIVVYKNVTYNNEMTIDDTTKPINITMTLTNKQGQSYEINTIIKRY